MPLSVKCCATVLMAAVIVVSAGPVLGEAIIVVGDHYLQQNMPNQQITLGNL